MKQKVLTLQQINNMKIIFFTKDRPMQYRAFLESFLYNAKDIKQSNIVTIISNTNGYEDILEEFKNIKFINDEGKFFNDILRNEIKYEKVQRQK